MAGFKQIASALLAGVSNYTSSNIPLTTGTPANVATLALPAGTYLIIGTALAQSVSAVSLDPVDIIIGPNTGSITGAYVSGSVTVANLAGGAENGNICIATVQTFGVTTNVFLVANGTTNASIRAASAVGGSTNASGLLAISAGAVAIG